MSNLSRKVARRARRKYGQKIVSRRKWGSRYPHIYAYRRMFKKVAILQADTLVAHISVTNPQNDAEDMRTLERIGYERFKSGVSYNYAIDMANGTIYQGMPLDARGTHTINDKKIKGFRENQNDAARAIVFIGQPNTPLSTAAKRSASILIASMIECKAITATFDFLPHSFFAYKDCPCDAVRNAMPEIRRDAITLRRINLGA